jgi:hypothetical protein
VKKVARKRARPVKPPSTTAVETVVVDVIEEPVPGVNTVTEFEETEVREPSESPEQPEEREIWTDLPGGFVPNQPSYFPAQN